MQNPIVYSQRLGAISDAQFEAVSNRLALGRFLHATPVTSGLFGQNVFVTTTTGEFVLRGAPHWVKGIADTQFRQEDRWQFTKERFFAKQLHERTRAPVPWPMLHDKTSDLLGWPYLVMPRMPGHCFDEHSILKALAPADRRAVAVALGTMLAELQQLTWQFAGDFNPATIALEAYPLGNTQWVIDETHVFTTLAIAHDSINAADRACIDAAVERARSTTATRPTTFVHSDFKLNNLTVAQDQDGWRVSGIFDLHEARFGDGALDIVRQFCAYLDTEPQMAEAFVESYRHNVPVDASVRELLALYVVNDRMKMWEYFTRPDVRGTWTQGTTFSEWVSRYMSSAMAML